MPTLADGADDVVIIYADNFSDIDLRPLVAFHRRHGDPLTMVLFRAPNPRPAGSPSSTRKDGSSRSSRSRSSRRATWPTPVSTSSTPPPTARSPRMKAFDLGFDVLPRFVGRMRGWVWGGYHLDIGTHEALTRPPRGARSLPGTVSDNQPQHTTAGGLPRPRRHADRACSLSCRPGAGPAPARSRRGPEAAPPRRFRLRAGDQPVGHRPGDAHRRPACTQIHAELNRQLAAGGASLDAHLLLPGRAGGDDRTVVENPDRKPGPGMLLRAAAELNLDLECLLDGRRPDQRRAGRAQRRLPEHPGPVGPDLDRSETKPLAGRSLIAPDLAAAADLILADRGSATMKILLTGGAGYVGSACLRWLLDHGHDPIAYDNLSRGTSRRSPRPPNRLIVGDIAETDRLAEVLREHGVEAVMHFAALASVPDSIADPEAYYRVNVGGTKSVLDAMRAAGVRKILFSSTAATYGFHAEMPLREDSPQTPETPYGTTKLAAEWLIKDYARAYGLGYTLLRYFNASGADPDGDFGEDRRHESHLIPLIFQVAVGRRPKVMIYGSDYPTRDGTLRARLCPHRRPGPGAPAGRRVARAGHGAGLQPRLGDRRDRARSAAGLRGGRRPADRRTRSPAGDPATRPC